MYRRQSFCGPVGDGIISKAISALIVKVLDLLNLDFEKACENHDINWNNGPNTRDDILFSLNVYDLAKSQKGAIIAWWVGLIGCIMFRITAIIYKILIKI